MNLSLILAVIFVSFVTSDVFAATCTLKFNKAYPGVFVSPYGRYDVILSAGNGTVQFDSNYGLDAYCSGGFKNYASASTPKPESQLKFTCTGSTLRYQIPGSSFTYLAKNDGSLLCDNAAQYYSQTVQYCKNTGLAYGFNIANTTSVIFGEVCTDFKKYRTDFVHYVAGVRNDLVNEQYLLNPGNVSKPLPANNVYAVNDTTFIKENQTLPTAIRSKSGNYAQLMTYRMDNLIPIKYQAGVMDSYVRNFQNAAAIPWWSNLLDFNWQQLQYLINDLSYSGWYDVYAGTSDDVQMPYETKNVTFTYDVNQLNRTIPLYVWNLVKKNDKKDTGVVVIGVNSPFFPGDKSKTVLCKDTCDKVTWLNPLKNTRKIASMGYIFCCDPKDVKKILNGFPQM
ncbi:unnamed protein product [Hermetia illucens]|uniref:Uncharacterized protein n=1 Tax=Hermetia illucens TaxID=343691 RepID=A0A7R8UG29_HERIL|nr:uncharacterized protein LOC119646809 [Hermetia illucens]CAD7079924.1 unnamed protein product [Hermetia illucens]